MNKGLKLLKVNWHIIFLLLFKRNTDLMNKGLKPDHETVIGEVKFVKETLT